MRKKQDIGLYVPRNVRRKMEFIKVDPDKLYFVKIEEGSGLSQLDVDTLRASFKGIGARNVMVIANDDIEVGERGQRQVGTEEA